MAPLFRFTSVAFAHSASPEKVKLVQTWPNANGSSADDVPSEVLYTNPNSNPREKLWGYEIPKDSKTSPEPLKWFKLLLQNTTTSGAETSNCPEPSKSDSFPTITSPQQQGNSRSRSSYYDATAAARSLARFFGKATLSGSTPLERTAVTIQEFGLTPVDVVSDFLSSVREITIQSIESSYDKDFVAQSKIEYILTIPAIWTDQAKNLVIEAAQKAQLGQHRVDFHLCGEPEAAAVYTFRAIQPHDLRVGSTTPGEYEVGANMSNSVANHLLCVMLEEGRV